MSESKKITIQVYIDCGNIYKYEVASPESAREHCSAIIQTGTGIPRKGR